MYNTVRVKQGNKLKPLRKSIILSSVPCLCSARSKMCEVTKEAKTKKYQTQNRDSSHRVIG